MLPRTLWFYIVRGFDNCDQMAGIDFDHELKRFPLGADHPIADNLMTDKEYQLKVVGAGSEHPHFEFVVIAEAREKHTLWSNWVHHLSLVHNVLQSEKTGWWLVLNQVWDLAEVLGSEGDSPLTVAVAARVLRVRDWIAV